MPTIAAIPIKTQSNSEKGAKVKTCVSWSDEKNQRIVKFKVTWLLNGDQLEILQLIAKKVTFICPTSNSIIRSTRVHTAKGRDILRDAFIAAGMLEDLVDEIAARNDLTIISNT